MDVDDGKVFDCIICGQVGNLLCCDNCPRAYHPKCVGGRQGIDSENWSCWECLIEDSARDGVRVPRVSTPMGPVWVIGGYVFRPTPPPSLQNKNGEAKSWEDVAKEAEEAEAAAVAKAKAEGKNCEKKLPVVPESRVRCHMSHPGPFCFCSFATAVLVCRCRKG